MYDNCNCYWPVGKYNAADYTGGELSDLQSTAGKADEAANADEACSANEAAVCAKPKHRDGAFSARTERKCAAALRYQKARRY